MSVSKSNNDINFRYRDLAEAIILQAVDDYRCLLRGKLPIRYDRKVTIKEIEEFFDSEFYRILTNINGKLLIIKLKEEYADECKNNTVNKRPYRNYR